MDLKLKRVDERAIMPKYASNGSAAFDLYCLLDKETLNIEPNKKFLLHTGWAMAIPEGYVGIIAPRSGLGTKKGLILSNTIGVIDSDYRGEVMVSLINTSEETQSISNFERIAQMMIIPVSMANLVEVEELEETDRGTSGFGSTGTN